MNKKTIINFVVVLIVVLLIVLSFSGISSKKVADAVISLQASQLNIAQNESFEVEILLDTKGKDVYGVDISNLNFDPKILQVVDLDDKATGTQIAVGDILDITAINIADNKAGTIKISRLATPETTYNGSGTIAKVKFMAINKGKSDLSFNFTPGLTTDTNVAASNYDALGEAKSITINVN